MCNTPYLPLFILCILCAQISITNSRSSNYLKLDPVEGVILELPYPEEGQKSIEEEDPIYSIIISTVINGDSWVKYAPDSYCTECPNKNKYSLNLRGSSNSSLDSLDDEDLDCGKPVNFTYYDNLVGVARRDRHPNVPEPHVSLIFTKKKNGKSDFFTDQETNNLERKLRKAKRERPKSVQLYNQIGNFWRLKGDTKQAIECFRRALAVSPHNPEVLLNLARVLYSVQYLDDAAYLTRRSLEVQPPDRSAWQQYFTLGEILKAYGHYQEASLHLKHALDLRPDFEPAITALRDIENIPEASVHVYTLLIIICLVMGVLLVILSSVDSGDTEEHKTHRHFNRAMAMRSLKGVSFTSSRARSRKGGS